VDSLVILPPGADQLAGGQRGLQPEHVVAGHPVLDRAHAAGVGADVAAHAGAQLAGKDGVHQPRCGGGGVEVGQRDPGLYDRDLVVGVDLKDLVHPLERDEQAVRAGPRGGRQAGSRAAGGHRHLRPGRGGQHRRNLLGGLRAGHKAWGHRFPDQRLVVVSVFYRWKHASRARRGAMGVGGGC
jgi:hypothetical protein